MRINTAEDAAGAEAATFGLTSVLRRVSLAVLSFCLLPIVAQAQNGDEDAGHKSYDNNCSVCHGGDGFGGEHGPAIARRLRRIEDPQLTELIHQGRSSRGCLPLPVSLARNWTILSLSCTLFSSTAM